MLGLSDEWIDVAAREPYASRVLVVERKGMAMKVAYSISVRLGAASI